MITTFLGLFALIFGFFWHINSDAERLAGMEQRVLQIEKSYNELNVRELRDDMRIDDMRITTQEMQLRQYEVMDHLKIPIH